MDSFELSIERLHARQMQFLKDASPDDWHRYAWHHNWDERLDGLFWIVSQPDCDRATAMMTFWKGFPTGYDYEEDDEPLGDDVYAVAPMLRYISERFNTAGYRRAEISYDFLKDHGGGLSTEYNSIAKAGRLRDIEELIDRQKEIDNPKVKLHSDLRLLSIPGRKVGGYADNSDFYDLFPDDRDDEDTDSGDAATTSEPSQKGAAKDEQQMHLTSDASVEASARIRAIRHQTDVKTDSGSDAKTGLGLLTRLMRLIGR
jgi:Domain of unknown function (DUF4274)